MKMPIFKIWCPCTRTTESTSQCAYLQSHTDRESKRGGDCFCFHDHCELGQLDARHQDRVYIYPLPEQNLTLTKSGSGLGLGLEG